MNGAQPASSLKQEFSQGLASYDLLGHLQPKYAFVEPVVQAATQTFILFFH